MIDKYTVGVCEDGISFFKNGRKMRVDEIVINGNDNHLIELIDEGVRKI